MIFKLQIQGKDLSKDQKIGGFQAIGDEQNERLLV